MITMVKTTKGTRFLGAALLVLALLVAVLLAAALTGCDGLNRLPGTKAPPEVPGGDDEAGGSGNAAFYVRSDGDDGKDGSEAAPFKTLAAAYAAALANPTRKTIVVLSDLDTADAYTTLDPHGKTDVITITSGNDGQRTLTRSDETDGTIVKVTGGAKVIFQNITINGKHPNGTAHHRALYIVGADVTLGADAHLVGKVTLDGGGGAYLESGSLTMEAGSTIKGEAAAPSCFLSGGGVYLEKAGTFTMNGGTVSGVASFGGGVNSYGTFTMNGGEVSGSTNPPGTVDDTSGGAGVLIDDGIFRMINGAIKNNTYRSNSPDGGGGGVQITGGKFIMEGGTMSGNKAEGNGVGGGVYVYGGTFRMINGTISGNTALTGNGGGVYNGALFNMEGGTISGNTTPNGSGGGVYANKGTFKMINGTISGNSAPKGNGGGVCNAYTGAFTMSGGTIYGKDDPSLTNNADQGAAYYNFIAASESNTTVKKIE